MAQGTHGDFLKGFRNSKQVSQPQSNVSQCAGTGITKTAAKQYRIV